MKAKPMDENVGFDGLTHALKQGTADDNTIFGQINANWRQGRTAYGGVTTALAYGAVQKCFDDLPPLRSMVANFIGPVGEAPIFKPRLLRRGRNVVSIYVECFSDDKLVATTTFIFGAGRPSLVSQTLPAPQSSSPGDAEEFFPPEALSVLPQFFSNFDVKLVGGARPLAGDEGYMRVWARHKDVPSRSDNVANFIALADLLPPAAMPLARTFDPISSINWTLNFLVPPTTQDGWFEIETRMSAANEGYSSQIMRNWNSEGILVAEGMQSVAIFF